MGGAFRRRGRWLFAALLVAGAGAVLVWSQTHPDTVWVEVVTRDGSLEAGSEFDAECMTYDEGIVLEVTKSWFESSWDRVRRAIPGSSAANGGLRVTWSTATATTFRVYSFTGARRMADGLEQREAVRRPDLDATASQLFKWSESTGTPGKMQSMTTFRATWRSRSRLQLGPSDRVHVRFVCGWGPGTPAEAPVDPPCGDDSDDSEGGDGDPR